MVLSGIATISTDDDLTDTQGNMVDFDSGGAWGPKQKASPPYLIPTPFIVVVGNLSSPAAL